MAVEAEKKAICVAAPDPAMVAVDTELESVAQYQYEDVAFHFKISSAWQPPRSLSPSAVTSRPELLDVTAVVPVVVLSIVISSALIVIPLPPPILSVRTPVVPPPVKPEPAVTAVVAYEATFAVSRRVPDLPESRLISVAVAVTADPPMNRFVTFALPATSRANDGLLVPIPRRDNALFHHKLLLPVILLVPFQNVSCPATPEPETPEAPDPVEPKSCHVAPL